MDMIGVLTLIFLMYSLAGDSHRFLHPINQIKSRTIKIIFSKFKNMTKKSPSKEIFSKPRIHPLSNPNSTKKKLKISKESIKNRITFT